MLKALKASTVASPCPPPKFDHTNGGSHWNSLWIPRSWVLFFVPPRVAWWPVWASEDWQPLDAVGVPRFFLLRCNHVLRLKLHIFIHLSIYLSIYLPTYRSVYLSVYLSIYVLFHVCIEDRLAICSWIFTIRNEMEYKWMIYWIEIERGPSFFFGFAMGGFSS